MFASLYSPLLLGARHLVLLLYLHWMAVCHLRKIVLRLTASLGGLEICGPPKEA